MSLSRLLPALLLSTALAASMAQPADARAFLNPGACDCCAGLGEPRTVKLSTTVRF
jgi:hypothetical protein